jgi:hypothetical protein
MINIVAWARLDALAEKADFLDGFFKVIMRLVDKDKYPIFFIDFYENGEVSFEKLELLLNEILDIENRLRSIKVNKQIFQNEPDFSKVNNYKDFLNDSATNMSECFLNPNKENMFEVFRFNIDYAIKKNAPVLIKYYAM